MDLKSTAEHIFYTSIHAQNSTHAEILYNNNNNDHYYYAYYDYYKPKAVITLKGNLTGSIDFFVESRVPVSLSFYA